MEPTLFGEWFCVREWCRIGSPGQLRRVAYPSQVEAQAMLDRQVRRKERPGMSGRRSGHGLGLIRLPRPTRMRS